MCWQNKPSPSGSVTLLQSTVGGLEVGFSSTEVAFFRLFRGVARGDSPDGRLEDA